MRSLPGGSLEAPPSCETPAGHLLIGIGPQRVTPAPAEERARPQGGGVVAARPRRRPGPRCVLSSGSPWSFGRRVSRRTRGLALGP
ncbi:hypothetical protein NDU88_001763 [Pleurodeles waltl]|uniref:Uncharacterized protein n=1 Tax=Pleurodeles waltl TaxID=8319 RepID=A0AAV7NC23_PLEWA|nr:hypothetical protein NDU88_001763 [Pleurodeles waltl]